MRRCIVEQTSEQIQAPVDELTPPVVDEVDPSLELDGDNPPAPAEKQVVHPLAPGGRRFEQVYAKGKQAEREAAELRERLAAAEARIDVLSGKASSDDTEKEYSWSELETFISQGRITRADAEAHREAVIERRIAKKAEEQVRQHRTTATRLETLSANINSYVQAIPAILKEDSADRQRLDEEFDWLASVQGVDSTKLSEADRKALQLTALRNVYGPVDSVTKRETSMKTESTRGLPGGTPPPSSKNPDQALLNGLSQAQKEHYSRMMKQGRYPGGWKDVVAELKFNPRDRHRGQSK